ncbi:MAG TPA: type IV toxin-antitoxin system AbiEi family antitoxin [Telluria sp.]
MILVALDALQKETGIEGKLVHQTPHSIAYDTNAGASIMLKHDAATTHYLVTCKASVDRKMQVDQVRRQLDAPSASGLLIAPYISREIADHCKATGLQFIDTLGNAFLHAPGLFVFITGKKSERGQANGRSPKGLTNAAGLRVVFGLLCKPELVTAPFTEIARATGVSLGTANNVVEDLERRGYLINKSTAARRQLVEPHRLVQEWTINYPTTLRMKLHGRRFTAPDTHWWKNVVLQDLGAVWGSEIAASKMSNHLKPATQTIYVEPGNMDKLIKILAKQCRIKPDQNGEIEILAKFWGWDAGPLQEIVPPLLVYADLLAIMDPRTEETANMIKERFVDTAFDPR